MAPAIFWNIALYLFAAPLKAYTRFVKREKSFEKAEAVITAMVNAALYFAVIMMLVTIFNLKPFYILIPVIFSIISFFAGYEFLLPKAKAEKIKLKGTTLVPISETEYLADVMFLSTVREEKWLNFMAENGYALEERRIKGYVFLHDRKARQNRYSVHCLEAPPEAEVSKAYIESCEKGGAKLICAFLNNVYLKTQASSETSNGILLSGAQSKRRGLKNMFTFCLFMLTFCLGMTIYNILYWVRFDAAAISQEIKAGFILKNFNFLEKWLGKYPSTPILTLFLVLTVIFIPLTAYFLDAYLAARAYEKELRIEN